MKRIAPRQAEALRIMIDHLLTHHSHAPVRLIADRMGIAGTNGVQDHIDRLVAKGFVERVQKPTSRAQGSSTWRILRSPDGSPFQLGNVAQEAA